MAFSFALQFAGLLRISVLSSMPMRAQICEAKQKDYVYSKTLSIRNDWLLVT